MTAGALANHGLRMLGLGPDVDMAGIGRALISRYSFDHFMFGVRIPDAAGTPRQLIWNNYPSEWLKRYDEDRDINGDPVVQRALRSAAPFFWDEVINSNDRLETFLKVSSTFGLIHGITIPLAAPLPGPGGPAISNALLNVARRQPISEDRQFRWNLAAELRLHASYMHQRALDEAAGANRVPVASPASNILTARERECLALVAQGKTGAEIAAQLNVAASTVAYHIDRCVKKLKVDSRRSAVGEAIRLGEISAEQQPFSLRKPDSASAE